jgi:hypothetical protein
MQAIRLALELAASEGDIRAEWVRYVARDALKRLNESGPFVSMDRVDEVLFDFEDCRICPGNIDLITDRLLGRPKRES